MADEHLPLRNTKILVTRSWQQAPAFTEKLMAYGAQVIEMPTLIISPPDSWFALDEAIASLSRYNWLMFTSANGVTNFLERLCFAHKSIKDLANLKIAVVGVKTAQTLQSYGLQPDLVPTNFIADGLVEAFQNSGYLLANQEILFPRVQSGSRDLLIEELQKMGAIVTAVPAYESCCPPQIDADSLAHLQSGTVNIITFASSKTVQNFCRLLDQIADRNIWQAWLVNTKFVTIGQQTSLTCCSCLGRVDLEAKISTLDGMVNALLDISSFGK
jgi:uroporphyrinogen III methyltransferase/synthase